MNDETISTRVATLHGALTDIVGVMNRPQRDEQMVREAGIALDRALFPLLVGIARHGPIGVVDLADRVGRDHTTVSRQVAALDRLGLVNRRGRATDRRVREAIVTAKGKAMTDAVDAARERIAQITFSTWDDRDVADLIRLVRRFADTLTAADPGKDVERDPRTRRKAKLSERPGFEQCDRRDPAAP